MSKDYLVDLRGYLQKLGKVVVAFSGGVDSTFLLKAAVDALGANVLAVTGRSTAFPERELQEALQFAQSLGVNHLIIDSEELDVEGFSDNPTNRCYLCKKELFSKIISIANEHNIEAVLDGSNADDSNDYRPGMKALHELGVKSPLQDLGIDKEEIRKLSKEWGLPTWDKPSFACLSSRFPYGEKITKDKLSMVDQAEQYLLELGFRQVRVRHHGELARIEVGPEERMSFFEEGLIEKVYQNFKKIGFVYTALDLKGYRTGSMNETKYRRG